MSERLVIKNFGPIKHVDLDIKKVNVLIGDQGTGKSTVAKVLAIMKDFEFLLTTKELKKDYFIKYNLFNSFNRNTEIIYENNNYSIYFKANSFHSTYSNSLTKLLKSYLEVYNKYIKQPTEKLSKDLVLIKYNIQKEAESFFYVPTERMYSLLINNTTLLDQKNNTQSLIPTYLLEFASRYLYSKQNQTTTKLEVFDVGFYIENGNDYIIEKNNKKIKLIESASGLQSTIPLIILINSLSSGDAYRGLFLIEEPELNLFPETQSKLIKFLVEKCLQYNDDVLFNTHSPYILSSLNNLIQAFITGKKKGKSTKVDKIIPKKYWLNPEDVSAYLLKFNETENGIIHENIIDKDGLIKTSKIDQVSKILNEEFDKIFNIDLGI
jgi:predicted ATPase